MQSKAATVQEYLDSLPPDRREAIEAIRSVILANLDPLFAEGMQYGMIGFFLPHSAYPAGYHCDPRQPLPFAALASQKNHIGIYLFCIYGDDGTSRRFQEEWLATGKRLDMGKGCVRVRRLADVPLEVLGATIKRMDAKSFVEFYERARNMPRAAREKSAATTSAATKSPKTSAAKAKTVTAKKTTTRAAAKTGAKSTAKQSAKNVAKKVGKKAAKAVAAKAPKKAATSAARKPAKKSPRKKS
ncbi:MAG: DUF1801 domain-containing protein [Planctomycetota bacterium]